jgi:hypothetical protein
MHRPRLLLLPRLALILGGLLTALGTTKVQHEINVNAKWVRTPAKVVDFGLPTRRNVGASTVFEVVPPGTPPFRVHVSSSSSLHDWDKDITLTLICSELRPETESCEVDAFADRWLEPMLLLIGGLLALSWSVFRIRDRQSYTKRT